MPLLNPHPTIRWYAFAATLLVASQAHGDCSIYVIRAELTSYCSGVNCGNTQNLQFRTPWPANDGKQHAVGELVLDLTSFHTDYAFSKPDDPPITSDEWTSIVSQLPVLQARDNVIIFGDSINDRHLARNMSYDLNALLLTGRTNVRWNWVTPLRASAARVQYPGAPAFRVGKTIHLSDAALCKKLDYGMSHKLGNIYSGVTRGHIRHNLNTTSDAFSVPVRGTIMFEYKRHLFVRAQPTNLNFGTNPTGKTMKRDISIGVSTSSQAQVRYTFSYTSISKTREDVLIDGRSLPAQFAVSVPASNITSFTDFKHQVSLTSPDAGKVDGYIRVVAEML